MPETAGIMFWRENTNRYNLIGCECGSCGAKFFPPRMVCTECHRESIGKMRPFKFKGLGTIHSFTEIHSAHKNFHLQVPYLMGMIQLDEGPKVTAQIVDCCLGDLEIGMRVRSVFRRIGQESEQGILLYGFKFVPDNRK